MAQFSVVNDLADCSNTTGERPHEFFDHTGMQNVITLWEGFFLHMSETADHLQRAVARGQAVGCSRRGHACIPVRRLWEGFLPYFTD